MCTTAAVLLFGRATMTFPQDLRYSFRMLLKSPATTTIAVITLALGIGANTAMFSLMRQLFVSNFRYKDLNTLVIIQAKNQEKGGNPIGLSVPDLLDFREQNTVFEGIATFQYTQFILDAGGKALPAPGFYVTPNLFTVLGVPPIAGRIFREIAWLPETARMVLPGRQVTGNRGCGWCNRAKWQVLQPCLNRDFHFG